MPEQGDPVSPGLSPNFDEPFSGKQSTFSQIPSRGPSPSHYERPSQPPIYEESDQSETSQQDSELGKADTVSTTPTTAESGDDGDVPEDIKRVHSGEFSQTEKDLEMLHSNTSQSTIRRTGSESPNPSTSGSSTGVKSRVAIKSGLEGHQEADEDLVVEDLGALSLMDDHSIPMLVAQHSRTPSRTKRRSVSSTMSLERRHSHHSTSGQWTTYPPEDYIMKLNETRAEPFTTPSEKYLLNQLSEIGFNIGQITHSVTNNACDSSAAAWWMLRAKQAERGETDDVINAKTNAMDRKNERAAAYAREERKRQKEKEKDKDRSESRPNNVKFIDQPSFSRTPSSPIELGSPIKSATPMNVSPMRSSAPLSVSPDPMTPGQREMPFPIQPGMLHPQSADTPPQRPPIDQGRSFEAAPKASPAPSLVDPTTAESSPGRPTKARSPSMSMLQRATSALVSGSWKNEDKGNDKAIVDEVEKEEKKSISPTKLVKPLPKSKMVKSESENSLAQSLESGHTIRAVEAGPSRRMSTPLLTTTISAGLAAPSRSPSLSMASPSASTSGNANKPSKRDAFWSWNSFRYMFNDPRRRRSRDDTVAGKDHKPGPAVVLSRGISGRGPHVNRMVQPIRRSSNDGRPVFSRRSSSVNSRRSSFNSAMVHTSSHDALPTLALGRRTSGVSHGSQTPTSEREQNPLSRPSSLHERDSHLRPSRRSSQNLRSPSMQSEHSGKFRYSNPASPLHNYQRRAPIGTDSRRVRHIRVIPEGHVMIRSESVASSIRSNASSRASSRERLPGRDRDREGGSAREDSDYDTGHEGSIRSRKRSRSDLTSLAQQIHRKNSPLTLPGIQHHRSYTHSLKPPEIKVPKAPLRDVFQGKEEEWVSDDEDIYSGGLGQKGQQSQTAQGKAAQWEPNARAMFSNPGKPHGHGRRHASTQKPRSRRGSSDEEDGRNTLVEKTPTQPVESVGGAGRRRGIPNGRGTAPVIQEEEEEEE
jgi:hypothetical protein